VQEPGLVRELGLVLKQVQQLVPELVQVQELVLVLE